MKAKLYTLIIAHSRGQNNRTGQKNTPPVLALVEKKKKALAKNTGGVKPEIVSGGIVGRGGNVFVGGEKKNVQKPIYFFFGGPAGPILYICREGWGGGRGH